MLEIAFVRPLLQLALMEDIGPGDLTAQVGLPAEATARLRLRAREPLVCAGVAVAKEVFFMLDDAITVHFETQDGAEVAEGETLLDISGNARALMSAERTSLNVLQRMCGVASLTRKYVEAVEGTGAVILDTRKTMPGMRLLDKYAVACGGARNHRMGLYDAVMLKDNHIGIRHGALVEVVQQARENLKNIAGEQWAEVPIIVECDTLAQVAEVLPAKPSRILLDNMSLEEMRAAVRLVAGAVPLEASGGVTLEQVRAIAETGVNYISVGRITHSVRSADIGADVVGV